MKQRFSISRDTHDEKIVIREYAELDKGAYSLLCEESYAVASIEAAMAKGPSHVLTLMRTESFFPTSFFAEKLVDTLAGYLQQGNTEVVKIEADDTECIQGLSKAVPVEESDSLDDLLEVDDEEIIDAEEPVGKLDVPIKIAEDESAEISSAL